MRAPGVVPSDRALHGGADHHLGRGDAVVSRAAAQAQPVGAGPDLRRLPASFHARGRASNVPVGRVPVDHADVRVGLHDRRGALQRSGDEQVVRGQQNGVVLVVGPGEAGVGRRDKAHVLRVAPVLHATVCRREPRRHGRSVVRRLVVDDQHPHVGAILFQDAAHAAFEDVRVAVARDDDADRRPAHAAISWAPRAATSRRMMASNFAPASSQLAPLTLRAAASTRSADACSTSVPSAWASSKGVGEA